MTQHKKDIEKARLARKPRYAPEPVITPGCCLPYPDVNFNEMLEGNPTLNWHHIGLRCGGAMEPGDFSRWYFGPHGARRVSR